MNSRLSASLHMRFRIQPMLRRAALITAFSLPALKAAQAQNTIAGAWVVRYERTVRDSHASASATEPAIEVVQGRLTLRQSGDSVFGEWQTTPTKGDSAPPPRNVHGVQRRDSVFLRFLPAVDPDAGMIATALHDLSDFLKLYIHGIQPTTTAIDAVIRGDALVGTRRTVLMDGTPRGNESVLTGTRAKS